MPRDSQTRRAIALLRYVASERPEFRFTPTRHREVDPFWGRAYRRPEGRLYIRRTDRPHSRGVVNRECWLYESEQPDDFCTHFCGTEGIGGETFVWSDGGFDGYLTFTSLVAQCVQDLLFGDPPFAIICIRWDDGGLPGRLGRCSMRGRPYWFQDEDVLDEWRH